MGATAAVFDERVQFRGELRSCGQAGVTIGQVLARAHEAVQTGAHADCPVCGGHLHARGLDGRCDDCGSRLS